MNNQQYSKNPQNDYYSGYQEKNQEQSQYYHAKSGQGNDYKRHNYEYYRKAEEVN